MPLSDSAIRALKPPDKDSLKATRDLRDDARELLAAGIDPAEQKKLDRHTAKASAANSFASVAQSYIDKGEREGRSERTTDKQLRHTFYPKIAMSASRFASGQVRCGDGGDIKTS